MSSAKLDRSHSAPTSSGTMSHLPSGRPVLPEQGVPSQHIAARPAAARSVQDGSAGGSSTPWMEKPTRAEKLKLANERFRARKLDRLQSASTSSGTMSHLPSGRPALPEQGVPGQHIAARPAAALSLHGGCSGGSSTSWREKPTRAEKLKLANERCRARKLNRLQSASTSSGTMSHLPSGRPALAEQGVLGQHIATRSAAALSLRVGCPSGSSTPWMEKRTRAGKLKLANERRRARKLDRLHSAPTSSGTMSHLPSEARRSGLIHPSRFIRFQPNQHFSRKKLLLRSRTPRPAVARRRLLGPRSRPCLPTSWSPAAPASSAATSSTG